MVKKILLGLVAVVAIVLVLALFQPDSFRVERKALIQAPPEKILPLLTDFKRFGEWSPWEHLDPGMKRSFSPNAAGVGATYAWDGNDKVGAGRMEILSADAGKVMIKLDFLRPIEGHNTTEHLLKPQGAGTEVTWAIFGPMPFLSKVMSVFVSMDRMIGKDFESGLAKLKAAAEK